jgi:hypothetical protein
MGLEKVKLYLFSFITCSTSFYWDFAVAAVGDADVEAEPTLLVVVRGL